MMTRKFVRRYKCLAISTDHADTPSLYCQQVGLHMKLLSAASSYIKPTPAAGMSSCSMVGGEGVNDCQYRATTRKSCFATDRVLFIQVQCNGSVFLRITYIKTGVIQRRLVWLLARMTRKFVKRFKFSGISSGHADTPLPYCQQVGICMDLLFSGSSYIESRPSAGFLCCSVVVKRRNKGPVVYCHQKQRLPCQ